MPQTQKKTATKKKVETKNTNLRRNNTKGKKTTTKKVTTHQKQIKPETISPRNIKVFGFHDLPLNTFVFDNVENPKAVVVIVHGMQEHAGRYFNFAKMLNKNGFIAIASDLRGHGHTAESIETLGYGEKDILNETVADQTKIISCAKEEYGLPIYLFGHSYGSMVSQKLIQVCPLIEKAVIAGTANGDAFQFKLGNFVATIITPFKKKDKRGGLIEKKCIESYQKKFERGNWLSHDEEVYDEFLKDEYCGGSFPFSFYKSLMKNMSKMNQNIDKIGKKKIFLIVGSKDPVGSQGKQVEQLYRKLLKHNINAKLKIYPDARHELINETCKEEVYHDIVEFFNN